jgi:dipeptidase E
VGTIVAIGGGEIGRPGHPVETAAIDRCIVRLTGLRRPRLLFLPTAMQDSALYVETVERHFGGRLGCRVDTLYLYRQKHTAGELRSKILDSDVIYVGGGNTWRMLRRWGKMGIDALLRQAYRRGTVLSGLSAGAICWFRYGSSDSRRRLRADSPLLRIRGLDLVPALLCPHYHDGDARAQLRAMMRRTPGVAIALDTCCAIVIVDGGYRILSSNADASAYKVYWTRGEFHEEQLPKRRAFSSLEEVTRR